MVSRAAAEFGQSAAVSLVPGATLFGYALGVAVLAALAGDLSDPKGLGRHFALLAAALAAAAAAPVPSMLAVACVAIGLGCSLTQRLLCCATSAVSAERRGPTIGWIIGAGLTGIVVARAAGPATSAVLGWRGVFASDAALAGVAGLAATLACARVYRRPEAVGQAVLPRASALWRGETTLRRAALQQAAVFAAFNAGWAIVPHVLASEGAFSGAGLGLVAGFGAVTALVSGRFCTLRGTDRVASAGFAAVSVASLGLAAGQRVALCCYIGMGLLDAGTQMALVANQARAQGLATTPAVRGRLAAIVTTVGFIGGAAGSAIGNLLAR